MPSFLLMTAFTKTFTDDFRTVSCAADPYDLRPVWDALTPHILEQASVHGPVVVLAGEVHPMAAHKALWQGLANRLLKSGAHIAYGSEWSHNDLERLIGENLKQTIPPHLRGCLSAADKNAERFIRVFRIASGSSFAPVAEKNMMDFLRSRDVSYRPHDAAKINSFYGFSLDQGDPVTKELIRRHAGHLLYTDISHQSPEGMLQRNIMLAAGAIMHMKETEAQIYIMPCGNHHVLGYKKDGKRYADSLTVLFQRAGVAAIPVYTGTPDSLEEKAQTALRDYGWTIQDIQEDSFSNASPSGSERAFLQKISEHSGGEITIFPEMTSGRQKMERTRILDELPQWRDEARDHSPRIPDSHMFGLRV